MIVGLLLIALGVLLIALRAGVDQEADKASTRRALLDIGRLRASFDEAINTIERNIADRSKRYDIPWVVLLHDGDETVRQDFAKRRRTGKRILALDFLKLRHRLPRSWFVALHSLGRRVVYPVLAKINGPSEVIGEDRFAVTSRIDTDTLVLFAVARSPRR